MMFMELVVILSVGTLLHFEEFASILVSHGLVTGPSQGESSGGAATLMPLDIHAFLKRCDPLAEWAQF